MSTKLTRDVSAVSNSDLEITYLDGDLNIIQKLDDEPNDVGGMTSAELKAKFDEGSNTIKEFINESLIPELLAADATEATRAASEAERVSNEEGRVSAEQGRAAAEATRQTNEGARSTQETQRAAAEQARSNAETARAVAEKARAAAEDIRVTSESARASAEQNRASAESSRAEEESARFRAEKIRVLAEDGRTTAEAKRVDAETARAAAEAARSVWEEYSSTKAYVPGNKVSYLGSSYQNQKACVGKPPIVDNAEYWFLVAAAGKDGDGSGDMKAAEYDQDGAVVGAGGIPAYVSNHVTALRGSANGLASLDGSGRLPTAQLTPAVTKSYYKVFAASDWANGTITIPAATHGLTLPLSSVMCQVSILSGGQYISGTWADFETYATVDSSGNVVLHYSGDAYAGAVLLVG